MEHGDTAHKEDLVNNLLAVLGFFPPDDQRFDSGGHLCFALIVLLCVAVP